jgi:hypothetical protein
MLSAELSRLRERKSRMRMEIEPRGSVDLSLCCQSRMGEGGIVPPHSVLAPGTALELLRSSALPSAQVNGIVGVWKSARNKKET